MIYKEVLKVRRCPHCIKSEAGMLHLQAEESKHLKLAVWLRTSLFLYEIQEPSCQREV